MTHQQQILIKQLRENLLVLEQSLEALNYSYQKCQGFKPHQAQTPDDLESWEALIARFARTSDILTQKVFKSLFLLLQEKMLTFLDAANFLEKIGVVEKADDLITIRELRNEVAHEYANPMHLEEIYTVIFSTIPLLIDIIERTKAYIREKEL
ncbi:MAG: hypothetical protein Q8O95_03435 [bacterium]|nr:hypothetical protein [bacterium]